MARFRVEEQGSNYQFRVSFDRVDILEAIYANPSQETEVIDKIEDYVQSRVSYSFDGQPASFDFESIEYTADMIILRGFLDAPLNVEEINVSNTCLVDDIDGHLNIMEFFLNDNKRYFRLHEGRTKTTVSYE